MIPITHPFRKVREKDGAPATRLTAPSFPWWVRPLNQKVFFDLIPNRLLKLVEGAAECSNILSLPKFFYGPAPPFVKPQALNLSSEEYAILNDNSRFFLALLDASLQFANHRSRRT